MTSSVGMNRTFERRLIALGRLTGLSGYDLKRYLFARATGHGLPF